MPKNSSANTPKPLPLDGLQNAENAAQYAVNMSQAIADLGGGWEAGPGEWEQELKQNMNTIETNQKALIKLIQESFGWETSS